MTDNEPTGRNPLGMRPLGPEGPFVLSPMLCSSRRREYFQRANTILGFYTTIAAYSLQGEQSIARSAEQLKFADETPIRLTLDGRVMQATYGMHKKLFSRIGWQLTNQAFLMLYGNLEAFLSDLVQDALSARGAQDPTQGALDLIMRTKWRGKLDRVSQTLGLGLGKSLFVNRFKEIDMGFLGESCDDPVEYLQHMAVLRHRLVHSSGRVDAQLARDYPRAGLQVGEPIALPFGLPYDLHFFYVPLTDVLDETFCGTYNWPRDQFAPEHLME